MSSENEWPQYPFQTPVRAVQTELGLSRLMDARGKRLDLHDPLVLEHVATALNASLASLPGPLERPVQVTTNEFTKRPKDRAECWLETVDTEQPVDFGPPGERFAMLEQIAAALNARGRCGSLPIS